MNKRLTSVLLLLYFMLLVSMTSARTSYYFAGSGTNHPPYDFVPTGNVPTCAPLCNPNTQNTVGNPNYLPISTGRCSNPPPFLPNGQLPEPFDFDPCCARHEQCIQDCSATKELCDHEFYSCLWFMCGMLYSIKPANKIQCRLYASCWASWLTRPAGCSSYQDLQEQACMCEDFTDDNSTTAAVSPSPSSLPSPIQTDAPSSLPSPDVTSSPTESPSSPLSSPDVTSSPTESPSSPLPSPDVTSSPTESPPAPSSNLKRFIVGPASSISPSASPSPSASASTVPGTAAVSPAIISAAFLSSNYPYRPIPDWQLLRSKCPPSQINWIEVMTDQEDNDIMFLASGASSLKQWWEW